MNCKLTIVFTALSFCAAAQPFSTNVPSVTLSDDPKNPLMTNHSSKGVIAALLRYDRSDGKFQMLTQMFVFGGELAAGTSQVFNGLNIRENKLVIAARVDAVIFSDGEFQGLQDQYSTHFQMTIEENFQAMKRAFNSAQSKEWAKLEAQSKERGAGFWGAVAATKLLDIHNAGGDINKLGQYGKLPTTTWRSGGRASIFQKVLLAFLGMFETTAHAQSGMYNTPFTYPQGSGTDSNHPNQWSYVCDTYPGSSYPCPEPGNLTPNEGIGAYCTTGSGYNIAVQINLAQDSTDAQEPYFVIPAGDRYYGTNSWNITGQYILEVSGDCYRQPGHGSEEYFDYDRWCDGQSPSNVPNKIRDTTGTVGLPDGTCGATAQGYLL